MTILKRLRLVALDIDGVALTDTFSPVIYSLVKKWRGEYDREIERNVFSQKRDKAAAYLADRFHLGISPEEVLRIYFREREEYLENNPVKPVKGLKEFLEMVQKIGLPVICYGGLDKSHFFRELGEFMNFFHDLRYICTNDFRPGIREIVSQYGLEFENVLFIDDVNTVAEEARQLNCPFIGTPSDFAFGFQKADMINTGVKYMVSGLHVIDEKLIRCIDKDTLEGKQWRL